MVLPARLVTTAGEKLRSFCQLPSRYIRVISEPPGSLTSLIARFAAS
jgi:hypothetical protein